MVRRLDTSRAYGLVGPRLGRAAFEQDHLTFDTDGFCIEDGPPPDDPPSAETHNGPASDGAVSLSAPAETITETDNDSRETLEPRPLAEWQTMDWPKLRKLLKARFDVWPKTRAEANAVLEQNNLVKGT